MLFSLFSFAYQRPLVIEHGLNNRLTDRIREVVTVYILG